MAVDNATGWIEWAGRASTASLLAAVLGTGYAGVWTWGANLDDVKSQRDEWKSMALQAIKAGEDIAAHPRLIGASSPITRNKGESAREARERLQDLLEHEEELR